MPNVCSESNSLERQETAMKTLSFGGVNRQSKEFEILMACFFKVERDERFTTFEAK